MTVLRIPRLRGPAFIAAVACLALSGCAHTQPDLHALYSRTGPDRVPVVVVHGILGARLSTAAGDERWPGGVFRLLFHDYDDLALPFDVETGKPGTDDLRPSALFDGAAGQDFYGQLIETLSGPGGYRIRDGGPGSPPTLYVFLYDWRRDNAESAARLDELVDRIRREHGDPALRVDIVAHSMGGLLVHYFVRFGAEDVLDLERPVVTFAGGAKVRKVILVGSPMRGSISGLQLAIMGAPIGFGTVPPEIGATWPSVYQLLPDPAWDWMVDPGGRRLDRDLYDLETWRSYDWVVFDTAARARIQDRMGDSAKAGRYLAGLERAAARNLARARRFKAALASPTASCPSRYIVFGGDCELTPARCLVEIIDGRAFVRLRPQDVAQRMPGIDYDRFMLEPGDGRVTKASALSRTSLDLSRDSPGGGFPIAYGVFLCQSHTDLPGDITFRDNLLEILLSR